MIRRNLFAVALLIFGCLQMAGHLADDLFLRMIGAASAASPLPRALSGIDGYEPFAAEVVLRGRDEAGGSFETKLTAELAARIEGPASRRRVYVSAITQAPRLPGPLWESVLCHGLGGGGPLRREFGLPAGFRVWDIFIQTRTEGRDDSWVLSPSCTR